MAATREAGLSYAVRVAGGLVAVALSLGAIALVDRPVVIGLAAVTLAPLVAWLIWKRAFLAYFTVALLAFEYAMASVSLAAALSFRSVIYGSGLLLLAELGQLSQDLPAYMRAPDQLMRRLLAIALLTLLGAGLGMLVLVIASARVAPSLALTVSGTLAFACIVALVALMLRQARIAGGNF